MKHEWEKALKWGKTTKEIKTWAKENYPNLRLVINNTDVFFGDAIIYNFIGDCGALYLNNAGCLDEENLKAVEELASINGFSKIFATIVQKMTKKEKQNTLNLWKDWTVVNIDKSNRTKEKTDIVLFKRINCSYKGY